MKMLFRTLQLHRSLALGVIFLFSYLGAIGCIFGTSLGALTKVVISSCILVNLIMVIRTYALRCSNQAIVEFWHNDNGEWYLKRASGDLAQAVLEFPIFISNYFIVLNFVTTPGGLKIAVPLTLDATMVKDDFRRLKVLLRTTRC